MPENIFSRACEMARTGTLTISGLIESASTLSEAGQPILARQLYKTWIALNQQHPQLYVAYFNCSALDSQADDFVAAAESLNNAIAQNPDFVPAYINLGRLLETSGAPDRAIEMWRTAANRSVPIDGNAVVYAATALKQIARVLSDQHNDAAEEAIRRCLAINPQQSDLIEQYTALRLAQCKWPIIEPSEHLDRKALVKGIHPLSTAVYTDDPLLQLAAADRYVKQSAFEGPQSLECDRRHAAIDLGARRLRVGYVSSDLRDHAIGYLMAEFFELHHKSDIEVFAYYCGPDSQSALTARIKAAVEHWTDIRSLSDDDAAKKIAADGIDILVDVNGHTRDSRTGVFARRPAPIQVNWLGYPGSMGTPYHHYIIADDWIIPQGSEIYYSEKVVRLPCYQPNDRKREIAAERPTRRDAGLPDGAFVFCCFNGTHKIGRFTFERWLEILNRVPDSVLWLLSTSEATKKRLGEFAEQKGISRARLVFAPKLHNLHHLARYPLADLFLDTVPYGAHTTASDALWMGVPVLTLSGRSFASRVCGSLVRAAGLSDLVCTEPRDYVARAIALGNNRSEIEAYKRILETGRHTCRLFDTEMLVDRLEDLYRAMCSDHQKGLVPRPDLANLDTYLEAACDHDHENEEVLSIADYHGLYKAKLKRLHLARSMHADKRLWTAKDIALAEGDTFEHTCSPREIGSAQRTSADEAAQDRGPVKKNVFEELRFQGYAPQTMLDVGAHIGSFTKAFLEVFPDCVPTLIEPNPFCHAELSALAFERHAVAASNAPGRAELFLTKDWLQSTGSSLYRENTEFFRDEVLVKQEVDKVRLDDLFQGRRFDFVKIDTQGSELDILRGGEAVLRQADYILIEISLVEYNIGGARAEAVFSQLASMGFRCADVTEFHRLASVQNGNLLQMDFLFERQAKRPLQNFCHAPQKTAYLPSQPQTQIEATFTEIYKSNLWGSNESVSGPGSTFDYTTNLRNKLPELLEEFSINSVFDAPCGDLNWIKCLLDGINIDYIGGDIVLPLIESHRLKYKRANANFVHIDLTKEKFPKSDLMICRDCLFHLSFHDTLSVLRNFVDSNIKYLLTTTHKKSNRFQNIDITTGGIRLIDLFSAPYHFPKEVLFRIEDWKAPHQEREMCLWSRDQVICAMNALAGWLAQQGGRPSGSELALIPQTAPSGDPTRLAGLRSLAHSLGVEGRIQDALLLLEHLAAVTPGDAEILRPLVKLLSAQGRTLEAIEKLSELKATTTDMESLLGEIEREIPPAIKCFNDHLAAGDVAEAEKYAAALAALVPGNAALQNSALSCNIALGRQHEAARYAAALLRLDATHAAARAVLAGACRPAPDTEDEVDQRVALVLSDTNNIHPLIRLRDIHDVASAILCGTLSDRNVAQIDNLLKAARNLDVDVPEGSEWEGWAKHYRLAIEAIDVPAAFAHMPELSTEPEIRFATSIGSPLDWSGVQTAAESVGAQAIFFAAADRTYVDLYARWYINSILEHCDVPCLVILHVIGGAGNLREVAKSLSIKSDRLIFAGDQFDAENVATMCYDTPPKGLVARPIAHFQSVRFLRLGRLLEKLKRPVFVSDIDILLQRGVQICCKDTLMPTSYSMKIRRAPMQDRASRQIFCW